MPDPDFTLKRNDTAARIQATLTNSGGTPVSIQGATVLFKMAPIAGGLLTVAGTAVIDQVGDATGSSVGQLHYPAATWHTGETEQAGLYAGEWEVTFSSGAVQTFPNGDPILIRIVKDQPL